MVGWSREVEVHFRNEDSVVCLEGTWSREDVQVCFYPFVCFDVDAIDTTLCFVMTVGCEGKFSVLFSKINIPCCRELKCELWVLVFGGC